VHLSADIFREQPKKKKKQYTKRTSSGDWLPDRLTARERTEYRRDMNFT
jgi:hypothetical protein